MHKPSYLIFGLLVTLCLAPGCGNSADKKIPQQTGNLEGSIPLKVGQQFTIKLPANPTGGYGWAYAKNLESDYLKEVDRIYHELPEQATTELMHGYETWTFKALHKGTSTIELVYKQHWRKDGTPTRTYNAQVIIS